MNKQYPLITGIGVVSACGLGKDIFWQSLEAGKSCLVKPKNFTYSGMAGEVNDKAVIGYLGEKGVRNLDRSALILLAAVGMAIKDTKIEINDSNTDRIGISTGTTFSHLQPILEFDREVFKESINFASPALFPSTVLNAASSQASIRYNIQGFNTTISSGFTSSLEAIKYAINSIDTGNADMVFSGGLEPLSRSLLFGLRKLGYLSGIKGLNISCPFDARRNGPVPGEGAGVLCVESERSAKKRRSKACAKILSVESCFDPRGTAKVYPTGENIEKAIVNAIKEAGIRPGDIDYISSCANSTRDLDKVEVKVLKRVFGSGLSKIPVSSIKSMIGETFSASGALQIISCIGAIRHSVVPPTINYKMKDPQCDINCVPNKSIKKKVDVALVISSGPGGFNSACVLEKA